MGREPTTPDAYEVLRARERKIRRKSEVFEGEDDEVAAARLRRELQSMRRDRQQLRERVAAAETGTRLDAVAIRARLEQMAQDVREQTLAGRHSAATRTSP